MNFSNISLFNVMKQKMSYHSARQAVLAQNIANADTPGYKAQDMKAPDFARSAFPKLQPVRVNATNEKHMGAAKIMGGYGQPINRPTTYERNPIENNVTIEEEMMRVAENQAEYQKVVSLYRKTVGLFNIALGRGSQA